MEVFLAVALIFIYLLTAFLIPDLMVKRVWFLAFSLAFILTAISIVFINAGKQTVLMQESEINWYYILYLFGSMSVILGFINLWIYRKAVVKIFSATDTDENIQD